MVYFKFKFYYVQVKYGKLFNFRHSQTQWTDPSEYEMSEKHLIVVTADMVESIWYECHEQFVSHPTETVTCANIKNRYYFQGNVTNFVKWAKNNCDGC